MGTRRDMGLEWSGEERTTDRPSAPAEAVYAVHDALPNLLWGHPLHCLYPVPNPDLRPPVSLCIGEPYNLFVRCTASTL